MSTFRKQLLVSNCITREPVDGMMVTFDRKISQNQNAKKHGDEAFCNFNRAS